MKKIKKVIVVGGGSAGWITACLIAAKHHRKAPGGVEVTLVESPNISTVGVGEGTWPTMRTTLMKIGVSETDFVRKCNATFKQGAKFAKWVTGKQDDFYYHPLMLPEGFPTTDLSSYWQSLKEGSNETPSYSEAVCAQETLCENQLAPKLITTPEYKSVANYAYHLDNGKFGKFLMQHGTKQLGVVHILDDVVGIEQDEQGDISHLVTGSGRNIEGDLFIDCTGFSSLLLGERYKIPFKDCSDVLFIDKALAYQKHYDEENAPIASHTISTAQSAGWIWDIGLQERRGVGHVYSTQYNSDENALRELGAYVGKSFDESKVREIKIRSGHRELAWKNNCVAIGLSSGFLEPLEASALVLIELSASQIADQLPANRAVMDVVAKRFNSVFNYRWQKIIEFLKLHYVLTQRDSDPFWKDNKNAETIPEQLQEKLLLWKYHPPNDTDFDSNNEVFPAASYLYVLLGMGFSFDQSDWQPDDQKFSQALQLFRKNENHKKTLQKSMPSNRELIQKINQYGLQRV